MPWFCARSPSGTRQVLAWPPVPAARSLLVILIMSRSSRRPLLRVPAGLLVPCWLALAGACLSDSVQYSAADDDRAMAAIASTWTVTAGFGAPPVRVTLCEDLTVVADDENTCQVEHTVRGGGRGRDHEESHGGVGCGGCPFAAVAYVTGSVTLAPGDAPRPVAGTVTTSGGAGGDEAYEYPYSVQLSCTDPDQPCGSLYGTLEADGTLVLQSYTAGTSTAVDVTLARTGAAACAP